MKTEALWYYPLRNNKVQCTLCPHNCIISEGKAGICRVRVNKGGHLTTEVNGYVSAEHFDPIEKKPLYHFLPGSTILSLGSYGCNLRCAFCQNCTISQTAAEPHLPRQYLTPEEIVRLASREPENMGIAFTYNEPTVWFEYMYDIAFLAKQGGLKTVMVTNGYINPEPLEQLLPVMDAFSVDLKAFKDDFYTKVTHSKLEPVKETIKRINLAGKHLELVYLVIQNLNDDDASFKAMVNWIASELGEETVLHLSRYFPNYKLSTEATPVSVIQRLVKIARGKLIYVYTGNMFTENSTTHCKHCGAVLILRHGYVVQTPGLNDEGKCRTCNNYFLKKT